jgi:hypothetical protein
MEFFMNGIANGLEAANIEFISENLKPILKRNKRVPLTNLKMHFDNPKLWRSVEKTELTAACLLYGNTTVRQHSSGDIAGTVCDPHGRPYPHGSASTMRLAQFAPNRSQSAQ